MANLSKTTQDHEEIRRWAEERGGKPSHVKSTGSEDDPGILRIDFPGYSGEGSLESISWDDWFEKFDESKLALLYEEETAAGERSNFNKIVKAETARQVESGSQRKRGSGASSSRGSSAKKATKKPAAKRSAATKTSSAKTSAKSAAKKGGAGKKAASKKGAAKKTASKKAPAKKVPAKKSTASKSAAKKSGAKKSGAGGSAKRSSGRRRR